MFLFPACWLYPCFPAHQSLGGCGNLILPDDIGFTYTSFVTIVGGEFNHVRRCSDYSFIGGGRNNRNDTNGPTGSIFSAIAGGDQNVIEDTTTYGAILGGETNKIGTGADHSAIFAGNGNLASGKCSVILGGTGNDDGGNDFTAVYGNGLAAYVSPTLLNLPSLFWVDELVAANIPVITGPGSAYNDLPNGALYTTVPTSPPPGFMGRPVFVK